MEETLSLQVGQGFPVALYAQCFTHLASCDSAGAVGELLAVLLAESWPFARSARDVSQTDGKYHTSISHDVRAVVDPSACVLGAAPGAESTGTRLHCTRWDMCKARHRWKFRA